MLPPTTSSRKQKDEKEEILEMSLVTVFVVYSANYETHGEHIKV